MTPTQKRLIEVAARLRAIARGTLGIANTAMMKQLQRDAAFIEQVGADLGTLKAGLDDIQTGIRASLADMREQMKARQR